MLVFRLSEAFKLLNGNFIFFVFLGTGIICLLGFVVCFVLITKTKVLITSWNYAIFIQLSTLDAC